MSHWEDVVERHRLYQEARAQRNAYFEKLAILDGGTVALVITAILSPLHGGITHKHLAGVGLTFLVLAMLTLLRRNFLAAQLEFHALAHTDPTREKPESAKTAALTRDIYYSELAGVCLSAVGVILLLAEVWLILA